MDENYEKIPDCPPMAWAAIVTIAKRGNDAIVKIRNGEIQIVESERKVKFRAELG